MEKFTYADYEQLTESDLWRIYLEIVAEHARLLERLAEE